MSGFEVHRVIDWMMHELIIFCGVGNLIISSFLKLGLLLLSDLAQKDLAKVLFLFDLARFKGLQHIVLSIVVLFQAFGIHIVHLLHSLVHLSDLEGTVSSQGFRIVEVSRISCSHCLLDFVVILCKKDGIPAW